MTTPPKGLARFLTAAVFAIAIAAQAQTTDWTVTVNGSPVELPRPVARIGGDLFVPVFSIAQALGFQLEPAPEVDGFRVRRGGGVDVIYDGRTGEVRFGPVIAGQLKNFKQITIAGPLEQLLFPLNGLIPLLAVDIQQDLDKNILQITSSGTSGFPSAPSAGLSSLDYSVGITEAAGSNGQYATLNGQGIAGSASLTSNLLFSGTGHSMGFRQGGVTANIGGRRSLTAGDQSTISGIDSMLSFVRGAGYTAPFKGFQATTYAGRAAGTIFAALGAPSVARYDSTIAGGSLRKRTVNTDLAFAANGFSGPEREGASFGAAYLKKTAQNQFRIQTVIGNFSGLSLRTSTVIQNPVVTTDASQLATLPVNKTAVQGMAAGLSLFDTYSPIKRLAITGQFDRYGKNFLTAREDSQFNAQTSQHLSLTYQASSNLSLFGRVTRREYLLGDTNLMHGFDYGASGMIPKVRFLQLSYFRSIQDEKNAALGRLELAQYSASILNIHQFFGTAVLSDIRFGQTTNRTITWTVTRNFATHGQFNIHDQLQVNSVQRYGADWQIDIPHSRGSLRIGMDRLTTLSTMSHSYVPIAGLNLALPGGHRLQLTYSAERNSRIMTLVIGGPVVKRQDIREDTDGRIKIAQQASLDGYVYVDADANNRFEPGKDTPLSDITVWLDNEMSVRTDEKGYFRFRDVKTGAHLVRTDISEVPADMTFEGAVERNVAILPFRANNQNFPVVRTGAVSGKLTYLDYTQDPDNPVEKALADGRIIADSEHDTYSDAGGNFTIGSLPPGTYHLKVDPETAPAGYVTAPVEVRVTPSETARGILIRLEVPPKPIIIQDLPTQQSQSIPRS